MRRREWGWEWEVTNDQNLRYDGNEPDWDKSREFQEEVHLEEYEEPEEDKYTRCVFVNDIPDDKRRYGRDKRPNDAPNEAKNSLTGGHVHAYGDDNHSPHETLLDEEELRILQERNDAHG